MMTKTNDPGDPEAEAYCQQLLGLPITQQRDSLDWLENNNPDLLKRVQVLLKRTRQETRS